MGKMISSLSLRFLQRNVGGLWWRDSNLQRFITSELEVVLFY